MALRQYLWHILGLLLLASEASATPPPGHVPTPSTDEHPPKYEYGYVVSGNEGSQGHVESRDGIYAIGRYHVNLPDGSGQKVTYFADDWGYHPLVSYASSTEHGASRTEFAMGEQAVAALKQTNSPVANLIDSPQPTQQVISTVSSSQNLYPANFINNANEVQVSNAGASGHHDHSHQPELVSTTVHPSTTPVTVSNLVTLSTTLEPPTVNSVTVPTPISGREESHSTLSIQTGTQVTPTLVEGNYQHIQNQIDEQREAHQIQQQLQHQVQQTLNQLEQETNQQALEQKQKMIAQDSQQAFEQAQRQIHHEQQIQTEIQNNNQIQQDINNRIQQNVQQQINEERRQQIAQQEIQNQIRANARQEIQHHHVTVTEAPQPQFSTFTVNQQYSPSIAPAHQYLSTQSNQVVSITPSQHYIQQRPHVISSLQSALSSILLEENPTAHSNVQIVTPTPILNNDYESYPDLSGNSILSNNTENDSTFTVKGNNVQITSYLADTNKVLQYGDRIQSRDRQAEQQIFDQIEEHVKQRIYADLQKTSVTNSVMKPIIVTGNPSTTTETNYDASVVSNAGLLNIASYNSGQSGYNHISPTTTAPPTGGEFSLINHGGLKSSSLPQFSAQKSDLSQINFGATGVAYSYSPRPYASANHLAPLQAGLAMLSAPENHAAPVNEESEEENGYKTVVDIQKGVSYNIPYQSNQIEIGQYQALGYERRLVDARAQQAIRDNDPNLQADKTQQLVIQQEVELQQVQASLQELQKKIVNEIDNQHEEEQRKQELVNNERQKHLDNLQKVANLIEESHVNPSAAPPFALQQNQENQLFNGPQYLPPQPTAPTRVTYHNYDGSDPSISYQNVEIISSGQNFQTTAQDTNTGDTHLAPPPAPPSIIELEKPVIVERPVAVETTKLVEIEKPVLIKETVPIETTKVVEVEKAVPVLQPYPVQITRVVTVDRPVAVPTPYGVPQPVPYPYAIPHPVEVPVPHYIPYPELLPIAFKSYHPVFIQTKSNHHTIEPSKRLPDPVFKDPRPELFQYSRAYSTIPLYMKPSPHKASHHRYYAKSYYRTPSGRNRNSLKNLRIEYGGFKPPLIPSTEFTDEPKPSPYGPSVKEE